MLMELHDRGILRTNNLLGDYAEHLVAEAMGLRREKCSNKGYDLVDESERKYEVKARRMTEATGARELGAFRNLDAPQFHLLAGVLFNKDFSVYKACLVPAEIVREKAIPCGYQHSRKFHLRDSVWEIPEVRDITVELIRAANV